MRNKVLDAYKFLFCCVIMLYHFFYATGGQYLVGGAGGVEFFVLAASLFFYRKFYHQAQSGRLMSNLTYGKKRLLRFLPYTTVAFIIAVVVKRIIPTLLKGKVITAVQLYKWFSKDIWEWLLVSMNGLNGESQLLNGPTWTLSAMLISEVLIWGLLQYNERLFRIVLAPVTILVFPGYWEGVDSAGYASWHGFTTFGVLRVFFLMCLGYYIYSAAVKLREVRLSKYGRAVLTACEFFCLGLSLVNMNFFSSRYFRFEIILLLSIVLLIAYSGQSYSEQLCRSAAVTTYLGELSLAIYLVHSPILAAFQIVYPDPNALYAHKLAFCFVVLLTSVLFLPFVKGLIALFLKLKERIVDKAIISV